MSNRSISYFPGRSESWIEAIEEKDLDRFTETFAEINEFFRHARYQQNRHEKLGDSLCQQAYYRAITPNIKQLSRYKVGTDNRRRRLDGSLSFC